MDEEYDSCMSKIQDVESELDEHLEDLIFKSKSNSSTIDFKQIKFVHSKYPYEIEVPEKHRFLKDVQKIDPSAIDITSCRSGFVRFRTTTIIERGKPDSNFIERGNSALERCVLY